MVREHPLIAKQLHFVLDKRQRDVGCEHGVDDFEFGGEHEAHRGQGTVRLELYHVELLEHPAHDGEAMVVGAVVSDFDIVRHGARRLPTRRAPQRTDPHRPASHRPGELAGHPRCSAGPQRGGLPPTLVYAPGRELGHAVGAYVGHGLVKPGLQARRGVAPHKRRAVVPPPHERGFVVVSPRHQRGFVVAFFHGRVAAVVRELAQNFFRVFGEDVLELGGRDAPARLLHGGDESHQPLHARHESVLAPRQNVADPRVE
mmetsp:Transcript_57084/g.107340  ORF Transcript_57084/g.107340 Transcript_57084/m.107340 type:complete len:258 (-) Transcript_57084:1411-2184(-)